MFACEPTSGCALYESVPEYLWNGKMYVYLLAKNTVANHLVVYWILCDSNAIMRKSY